MGEGAPAAGLTVSSVRASSRATVVLLHCGGEPLPRTHRGGLAFRLRELLRVRDFGPSAPSEVEAGPTIREWRQDVVGPDVAPVADPDHVPSVRRAKRDNVPRPVPSVVGFLKILEDDATRSAFNDLPLIRLPFQARILGGVIRAPSERKVKRNPERDADAIFGTGPDAAGSRSFHGIDASIGRRVGDGREVR